MKRKKRAHPNQEIQPWEGQKKFGNTHEPLVNPATVESRDGSHDSCRGERYQSCEQARAQRDLPAEQEPGEFVARPKASVPSNAMRAGQSTPNR